MQISSGQSHLASLQQTIGKDIGDLSDKFSSAAAVAQDFSLGFSSETMAALKAIQDQATSTIQGLIRGLEESSDQVKVMGAQQAEATHASLAAVHAITATAQQHLDGECGGRKECYPSRGQGAESES